MSSTTTLHDDRPVSTRSVPLHAWCGDDLDPFVASPRSHSIAEAPARARVVVRGGVGDVRAIRWTGGPVLEVTMSDGTGDLCLAFLGRQRVTGLQPGRGLTAAGTIASRRGRPVMLNPWYWLHAAAEGS